MRKFVAALFGCCAPNRTPSESSSLDKDGIPADPRDIDEGSLVSSTESFGVLLYGAPSVAPSSKVASSSVCPDDVKMEEKGGDVSNEVKVENNCGVVSNGDVDVNSECHSSVLSRQESPSRHNHLDVDHVTAQQSCSSLVFSVMSEVSVIEKRFSRDFSNWRLEDISPTDSDDKVNPTKEEDEREEQGKEDRTEEKEVESYSDDKSQVSEDRKEDIRNCLEFDSSEPPTSNGDFANEIAAHNEIPDVEGVIPAIYVINPEDKSLSSSETSSIDSNSSDAEGYLSGNEELKNNEYGGLMITPEDDAVLLEGYLYKRSRNTFKTWKRRYFMIKTNQLQCQKRGKGSKTEDNNKIVSEDLRISQVRSTEEQDRRYCFELIMPTKKIYLQADSQKVKDAWIKSLQCGIEAAIHSTLSPDTENDVEVTAGLEPENTIKSGNSPEILQLLQDIKNMPGNGVCADCCSNEPVWASINLGVTLCIGCSGIHRNLGVHISKVRSIELDTWEMEQCLLMLQLGNTKVNSIYEYKVIEPHIKPSNSETLSDNEVWIRAKYEEKLFLENREFINANKRPKSSGSNSLYKGTSISYDPSSLTGGGSSSVKLRAKRENAMRPLSKIFQNMNRKKRGGSDGTADIDTDHDTEMDDRAMSPQYAPLGTEEPNGDSETHTETCVPDNLLSKSTLSNSTPDLVLDNEDPELSDPALNMNFIGPLALNNSLFEASLAGDLDTMFTLIAEGADVNFRNGSSHDSSPLIQAVHSNRREAVQLLVINGSDVNQLDDCRQTALHHATLLGSTDLACLLLRKGADQHRVNSDNKDVLDIAVQKERASLVTVLRYIRLNNITDPTSQHLLSEFSRRPDIQR